MFACINTAARSLRCANTNLGRKIHMIHEQLQYFLTQRTLTEGLISNPLAAASATGDTKQSPRARLWQIMIYPTASPANMVGPNP